MKTTAFILSKMQTEELAKLLWRIATDYSEEAFYARGELCVEIKKRPNASLLLTAVGDVVAPEGTDVDTTVRNWLS